MSSISILLVAVIAIAVVLWLFWRGARQGRTERARLEAALWPPEGDDPNGMPVFHATSVAQLPGPAARYLCWSIADGTPLARAVRLTMTGRIRLGRGRRWIPLRSEELLHADEGFVWKATTSGALPISGFDRYFQRAGAMNWRFLSLIPVMRAQDANVSRSALHRFAMERMLVPASLLPGEHLQWHPVDEHTALLKIHHDGHWLELRLTVDPDGMPRKVTMPRWGNFETEGGQWQEIPYAVRFEGVYRSGGYTLPHEIRASWWANSDRELDVVNLEITQAVFSGRTANGT